MTMKDPLCLITATALMQDISNVKVGETFRIEERDGSLKEFKRVK